MNNQFTDEQIKAYANAFTTGDAIWSDEKWHGAFYEGGSLSIVSPNQYHIKNLYGEGVVNGFKNVLESSGVPYRVTTLEDYKLQGGEKIIWLGKNDYYLEFGGAYIAHCDKGQSEHKFFIDADGYKLPLASYSSTQWGVIPRYEQVTPNELREDSTLTILGQKLTELRKEHNELQKDILEKQSYERKLAEVAINLEKTIDSLKNIGK